MRAGGLALAALASAALVLSSLPLARHPTLGFFAWIAAIASLVLSVPRAERARRPAQTIARRALVTGVILLPAAVRVAGYRLGRIHGDDLLTAYFSANYDLLHRDFFAPVPPSSRDWVTQFPAPFFALQKLFFLASGESLLAIKLSVLPYVVAISGFLFLITRELLDERAAMLAVVVYAFLGPSVYLETLGLHFVSSSAVFLAFFHFSIIERRRGDARAALLAGAFAGACYLFYFSSFLALPIAAMSFFLRGTAERERSLTRNLMLFALAFVVVVGPFVVGHESSGYFLRRFEQVALIGGEWSPFRATAHRNLDPSRVVWRSLWMSWSALGRPGIGGHGGYDFGHRELLEPLSALLAALGALRAIGLSRRNVEWALVLSFVGLSFLTGMVMTIPPPAFHRFSGAFPFLALLIALPIHGLLTGSRGSRGFRHAAAAAVLTGVIATQTIYFHGTTLPENDSTPLRLARFIDEHYPERALYVAAFPGYAFEKIYHFVPGHPGRPVRSEFHAALLREFDAGRSYVYLITLPKDFDAEFERHDPRGRIVHFDPDYSLFVN